jgi:cytoskeletal protein CcmA (bactofilin family)
VIPGSLFLSGSTISMQGTVHGDVYCVGQKVTISGIVDGDVLCAAQTMQIPGSVKGNVRTLGQTTDITGSIYRNFTTFSQSLFVRNTASVSGEVLFGGQTVVLDGTIAKSIDGFAQNVTIDGFVKGNIVLEASIVTVGDHAAVNGSLTYTSDKELKSSGGASISGTIVRVPATEHKGATSQKTMPKSSTSPWPANALPSIFMYLIVGCLAVWLFPLFTKKTILMMTTDALGTGLVGAIALMVTPIAAIVIFATLIGIPAAILLGMAYVAAILVSRIFVANIVGAYVLDSFGVKQKANMLLQMLVGVPLLWFMFKAPVVGGFIGFLAVCWGLGGMIRAVHPKKR